MRGSKAKLLRKVANMYYSYDTKQDRELTPVVMGQARILQINQDGSTEEIKKDRVTFFAEEPRRRYKALKSLYKTHGNKIFDKGGK